MVLFNFLVLLGKFLISISFSGIYLITSELYPTIIRGTLLCCFLFIGNCGSVVAPYINLLVTQIFPTGSVFYQNFICPIKGELYWQPSPFICYGAISLLSALLTLIFVPETRDMELYDTFENENESINILSSDHLACVKA